jgi:hypothetical protein
VSLEAFLHHPVLMESVQCLPAEGSRYLKLGTVCHSQAIMVFLEHLLCSNLFYRRLIQDSHLARSNALHWNPVRSRSAFRAQALSSVRRARHGTNQSIMAMDTLHPNAILMA